MLQRKQTIYLLIGTVLSIAIVMSGLVLVQQADEYAILGVLGIKDGGLVFDFLTTYPLAALAGVLTIVQGYALVQYKNRGMQMKLVRSSMLLGILYIAYLGYMVFDIHNAGFKVQLLPSAFHIVLILFANFLALNGIKKDEALVKSVDRIR